MVTVRLILETSASPFDFCYDLQFIGGLLMIKAFLLFYSPDLLKGQSHFREIVLDMLGLSSTKARSPQLERIHLLLGMDFLLTMQCWKSTDRMSSEYQ